jgi:hypothetical protein
MMGTILRVGGEPLKARAGSRMLFLGGNLAPFIEAVRVPSQTAFCYIRYNRVFRLNLWHGLIPGLAT